MILACFLSEWAGSNVLAGHLACCQLSLASPMRQLDVHFPVICPASRDVYLLVKPREHIRDFFVRTPLAFDAQGRLAGAR